jgi:hypothetical protein
VLLGGALAFLVCCLAGNFLRHRNCYDDFQRFHGYMAYTSLHYPTVSHVRALARSRFQGDRIGVVVAGNSVLLGTGSRPSDLWTNRLQELLGDDYRVLNLATCGAQAHEFGAVAAEVLLRDHPRLILVTNTFAGPAIGLNGPDGSLQLRYFFWEAYRKGWLLPHPEREAALRQLCTKSDPALKELQAQMQLDQVLGFRDLWTTVEQRYVSTVWFHGAPPSWTKPRCRYPHPKPHETPQTPKRLHPGPRPGFA